MRTRNATPKTPASQKKTPAAKKSATKTPPSAADSTPETPAVKSTATPPSITPPSNTPEPQSEPKSEPPVVEEVKASAEEAVVSPPSKGTTTRKVTKRIVRKKVVRPKTPASAKDESAPAVKTGEADEGKSDVLPKEEDVTDAKDEDSLRTDEVAMKDAEVGIDKGKQKMDVDESLAVKTEPTGIMESLASEDVPKSVGNDNCIEAKEEKNDDPEEDLDLNVENLNSEKESQGKQEDMDDDQKENLDEELENKNDDNMQEVVEGAQPKGDEASTSEGGEDYGEEEGFVEPGDEDLQEDEEPEVGDDMKALDEESKELAAAAKERKVKKELEIFVGGLAREVVEDDVKKAFEKVGEVVEVRLLKDPATNKNRGFAFVRFASKDQAKRALSEMKNPIICGKRCGTAPNEDNDTLFLGNICNTWTKEAIRQKLKEYNVEGVDNITLVQDPRHEGLSRGFCFIQFACHGDAMNAYKRLQKTDVIFGHAERTAKVAFAEPLQEPDPEVMAKVKSVFIDGLPPHWDEDRVRKHFKTYGDIERITLARNMSSAKRKDFGFVDFMTHEGAIACIEDVNSKELVDGNSKTKVRARLSNPLPKTQAVKGGMCGGFRIGRPSGRSFGRTGPPPNRPNFQYGRPSRGQFNEPLGPFGRRAPYRAGHGAAGLGPVGRPNFAGPRGVDRSYAGPVAPRREPFTVDDSYSRPYMGRQYDDPYAYDNSHGLKRPYYSMDQDPSYMEASRVRPRYDYPSAGRGTYSRDDYGAGSSFYSSGHYGPPPDYTSRPHSSFNGRDRSYGGGGSQGYYY